MRFVVFDLEANADSPHPEDQEIVEIGALAVSLGNVTEEFHSLVAPTPGRSLNSLTVKLTGITEETLLGAPLRRAALSKFLHFCGNAPLVAHNGHGYDYPLLVAELDRVGLRKPVGERLDSPLTSPGQCLSEDRRARVFPSAIPSTQRPGRLLRSRTIRGTRPPCVSRRMDTVGGDP